MKSLPAGGRPVIRTVAMVPLSCTHIERMYLHDVAMLTEAPPPCPQGHTYRPDTYIVGWDPCLCVAGRTGHRTCYCILDDTLQVVPPCARTASSSLVQGHHRAEPPVDQQNRVPGV